MKETDLIIIGSGPGGYRAAEYAARHGLQVLIIEENEAEAPVSTAAAYRQRRSAVMRK